jgi:hypothetical protein
VFIPGGGNGRGAAGRPAILDTVRGPGETLPDVTRRPRRRSLLPWMAAAVAVLLLAGGGALGWWFWQKNKKGGDEGGDEGGKPTVLAADLALVPPDALGFVSVRVADFWDSDPVKEVLRESPEAAMMAGLPKNLFGLGPADVERATYVLKDYRTEATWVLFRTVKPYDQKDLLAKIEKLSGQKPEKRTHKDKDYYVLKGGDNPDVLHFLDDRMFVFAREKGIRPFLELSPRTKAEGPLAPALERANAGKRHLVAGMGPLPDDEMIQALRKNPPPDFKAFSVFLDEKSVLATVHLGKELEIDVTGSFADADTAKKAKGALEGLKGTGRFLLDAQKQNAMGEMKAALEQGDKALESIQLEQDGPEVRIRAGIEVKASTVAALLKTFAPMPGR